MKATVRDAEALRALKPLEVASYLRSAGWTTVVGQKQTRWSTWLFNRAQGDQLEIALPWDRSLRDFPQRMADALTVLEAAEQRSQLDILRDLLLTAADVVRIGLTGSDIGEGTIPIEDGAQCILGARDMMLAAACAAVRPREYYPSRKPSQATEYLREVRLGQTEPGSFVLTIISRVSPSLVATQPKLFGLEEPFERKVTQTLANSLAAVRSAAEVAASTGAVESFLEVVPKGVSANLCDALVGLAASGETSHCVEFGFTWSRSRPLANGIEAPKQVVLPVDAIPVIEEAARYFKGTAPREEFDVCGPVIKLERNKNEPFGRVTVLTSVDEQQRKVTIELANGEYHKAVTAHAEEMMIRCSGVLRRDGRAFRLEEVSGFSVESESDD